MLRDLGKYIRHAFGEQASEIHCIGRGHMATVAVAARQPLAPGGAGRGGR
jgi:hypothetical protein